MQSAWNMAADPKVAVKQTEAALTLSAGLCHAKGL